MSFPIRIYYEKTGRAKYISHLDMERCMQRAFKRCRLPVWYTEGFNKRMYLSFTVPLSLGFESRYEVLECKLEEDLSENEVISRVNAVMPEGIKVYAVKPVCHKPAAIASVSYDVTLRFDARKQAEKRMEEYAAFLQQEHIFIEKKNKKGVVSELDLKPLMQLDAIQSQEDGFLYGGKYAYGQSGTVNPLMPVKAFAAQHGLSDKDYAASVVRTGIFLADGALFT